MRFLTSAQKASLAVMEAGMVNNPNVCIEGFGSTFVCICPTCTAERSKKTEELLTRLESELT